MTPADLAARLSALDWTQCSLQHQLAISAAVETLGGKATVVNYPYQPGDPRFDGSEAFECYQTAPPPRNVLPFPTAPTLRWTRLLHLDGREWASAGFMGQGDAWGWIVESVAAECECGEDDVHCVEDPEGGGDLVTVAGAAVYRIAHGHAPS